MQTVLRRLKCWEGITTLRSSIGCMLDGSVNALLMPVQDFTQCMHRAAAAVADLSNLVLQPAPTAPLYWNQESKRLLQQEQQRTAAAGSYAYDSSSSSWGVGGWQQQQQQRQQADACVLQLLLSFRMLELLAALIDLAGVHGSRLAAQLEQQQQQQGTGAAACVVPTGAADPSFGNLLDSTTLTATNYATWLFSSMRLSLHNSRS
jgi:hypothetical protein